MNRVDGKVALVSGAGRGIGAATARLLAEAGARVAVTDVDESGAQEVAQSIREAGGEAIALPLDVTLESAWERALGQTGEALGGLHVLVNNAGLYMAAPVEEMSLDDWRKVMGVNLDGTFLGTKHGVRAIKASCAQDGGTGSIVNLSSIAGLIGAAFGTAYHASKGGVRLLTKAAALECAALGYPIRVNSVHPAVVATQMAELVVEKLVRLERMPDTESSARFVRSLHPMGRFAEPHEVARAILFLASDDSSYVNGSELPVDGAYTAR